jgi:predicted small lipoprotein YifL
MRLRRLFLIIVAVASISFITSCGKKGDPTLKTFEKPMPVKEIRAVHREDELIISWSYPAAEREKIKGFHIEKAMNFIRRFVKDELNFDITQLVPAEYLEQI